MRASVKSVEKTKVTLKLSYEEAELLAGLVDFPSWDEQPKEVLDFLVGLHDVLRYGAGIATYLTQANDMGYVPVASFGEDA